MCTKCLFNCLFISSVCFFSFFFKYVTSLNQRPQWSPLTSLPQPHLIPGGSTSGNTVEETQSDNLWWQQLEPCGRSSENHKQVTHFLMIVSQKENYSAYFQQHISNLGLCLSSFAFAFISIHSSKQSLLFIRMQIIPWPIFWLGAHRKQKVWMPGTWGFWTHLGKCSNLFRCFID